MNSNLEFLSLRKRLCACSHFENLLGLKLRAVCPPDISTCVAQRAVFPIHEHFWFRANHLQFGNRRCINKILKFSLE